MTTKKELHIVYTNIKSKENTLGFYESLDMKKRDKSLTCDNDENKSTPFKVMPWIDITCV